MGKRDGSPVWITPAEFQVLAKDHPTQALKAGHALRKEYIAEVKALDDAARTVSFRITTGEVDRDHDIINPAGWDLKNYLRNPVVMFAHDYSNLPVAKALNITSDGQGLVALAEFAGPEVYPFADTVFKMVKGGFLNATSVGFRPEAWTYNETRSGIDFASQELLEFSIVPVPANPGALVEARSAGIDLTPLKSWAEETLDRLAGESGLYVPRSLVEAVAKITSGMKTISLPAEQKVQEIRAVGELGKEIFGRGADAMMPLLKRGRVLSALNEGRCREAMDYALKCHDRLKEMIAQFDAEPAEEAAEPPEQKSGDVVEIADEPTIDIHPSPPAKEDEPIEIVASDPPTLELSPELLTQAIRDVLPGLTAGVGEKVEALVAAELNRLRGRID